MTTNDWSIHDGTALRAVLPLTITRAGRDPYGRTFVCGAGWRLDLLCDWTLADPAGVVLARDQDPDETVRAVLARLAGRALAGVECPEDAYNPVFTLDDGHLLAIGADYDGDPWHLSVDGVLDLEGPGPGDHNAWLAGNLADEP